ncbi:LutC/YkgG family protein [Pseudonocardia sp.]|jgi:L-lactate dehydrogenase complex protein LldG|uniref:LutC/YkgG family protein n=1 Tax=Pseudonocardia sp. TaxID=60912 RepID=UPI003D0CC3C6
MTARDQILARIRAANATAHAHETPVPRGYERRSPHVPGSPELLDLLTDRLVDYKATVVRVRPGEVEAALAEALAPYATVLLPPDAPWGLAGTRDDAGLGPHDLDRFSAVVTGCAVACAETGTIALDAGPAQGRRAITLVPDVHVCVVHADQVVGSVPEMLAALTPTRPITFISGPSATSDIELQRVEGVHGPRTLIVVLTDRRDA